MRKITILGAGAFGFAIAKVISENQKDKEIYLYDVNADFIDHIKKTRQHPVFHSGVTLPLHIVPTKDLKLAVKDTDLMLLAVPSKYVRGCITCFKNHLTKDIVFVNLAKGLEKERDMRISEIIDEELKDTGINYKVCSLSGGMIAREVTRKNPLCAELACTDKKTAKKVAPLLYSDFLRIETSDDVLGVELAGAFKNVIAIGAGIFDGLGYGESSKSAFVSAAAKQMKHLAIALGAKEETFDAGSQAWFGDLMTTCFGRSRNRELGEHIGKGMSISDAIELQIQNNKSIEGYITANVIHKLVKKNNIQAPLLHGIHNVLYKGTDPKKFVKDFITSW